MLKSPPIANLQNDTVFIVIALHAPFYSISKYFKAVRLYIWIFK